MTRICLHCTNKPSETLFKSQIFIGSSPLTQKTDISTNVLNSILQILHGSLSGTKLKVSMQARMILADYNISKVLLKFSSLKHSYLRSCKSNSS
ncbi:hypothetical protein EUGRSUZ_A02164 [Eucalyptus grandis]|uniref:Uncharacterized protein n=2 Tax=Eucalyptus grandis TaxID=71139 RepID=A0ACC3M6P7_EUCGR|nr:hypothetical protein EUGRSUZ_A02164 [Eucalyptus grandis]